MTIAGRGHRGDGTARGRQLRLRRLPDQRRGAAGPGAGDRGDHHHPGRAGVLRAAAPRRTGPPRHRRRPRRTRCTSTRWTASSRSAWAATAHRSTSTSTSWTAPAARTSRSAASPASRPRPATRCSCCTPSSAPGSSAPAPSTPRRWCSRSRARTCCSWTTPTSGSTTNCAADYAGLGLPAEPFASVGFYAPPTPDDPTGRPHVTGRTSGVDRVLVDPARVLRRRTAALRVRRRRGRTQPVHDGRQPGRRPAPAGRPARRARTARVSIDGTTCRTYDELVDVIIERLTDDATRPQWAGPVTGVGTINAFIRRLRSSLQAAAATSSAPTCPTPARRQISTGNQQVTVVDLHNLRERAQRFVVGVVLAAETARKEACRAGQPAVHHDRRAQQVRPAGGQQPDQGRPARHRRTRPLRSASS